MINLVTVEGTLRALYKAAFVAGATAAGGPVAGASATGYVNSSVGNAAIDRAVQFTVGSNDVQTANLATGGFVMNPTLAMIGEAGPELVVPINRNRSEEEYMRLRDIAQKTKNQALENQLALESGTRPRKFNRKVSPKARKSRKNLSKALREANARLRKKNGQLKKGKTQADVMRLAQRLKKKM